MFHLITERYSNNIVAKVKCDETIKPYLFSLFPRLFRYYQRFSRSQ